MQSLTSFRALLRCPCPRRHIYGLPFGLGIFVEESGHAHASIRDEGILDERLGEKACFRVSYGYFSRADRNSAPPESCVDLADIVHLLP